MRRSVYPLVLASMVTLVDLAVFILYMPIHCEAWGTNRPFMAAAMLWAGSLANLWKIASRSMRVEVSPISPTFELPQLLTATQGGGSHV
jgi:hypothetical protein